MPIIMDMNRLRIGLTSLALVFLSVLLVAALFGPVGVRVPSGKQTETLATLGVTPGAEEQPQPEGAPLPTEPVPEDLFPADPLPAIPADPRQDLEDPASVAGELTEI